MALPVSGSTHLIPAYYSIYRPRKDERLSWPSWLTYSGWLTHITHQLQVERRTGKVRQPETDVLPLCHATAHCIKVQKPTYNNNLSEKSNQNVELQYFGKKYASVIKIQKLDKQGKS